MQRRRRCAECQKPLGSTTGTCYECGGENYRANGPEAAESWATQWKVELGIPWPKIQKAHKEFSHK